jgi:2-polyprenyl-3-methyl-5-hydroxy-6-metoxy-1,4-benzoquinol methylase
MLLVSFPHRRQKFGNRLVNDANRPNQTLAPRKKQNMSEYLHRSAAPACSDAWILPVIQLELAALPAGSVVADMGCGNGALLAQLRAYGFKLHGLDMSRSGLAQGERAYPGIEFNYADLTAEIDSHPVLGKCDVVISTEVVEHVFLPRVFAANCFRMLKPEGRLLVSTPYHGYLKNLALAATGKLDAHFNVLWDYGHIKFWSARTLTALLREAGFEVERFRGAGRLPFLWKTMFLVARKPA